MSTSGDFGAEPLREDDAVAPSSDEDVDGAVAAAAAAAPELAASTPSRRALLLDGLADALDAARAGLVEIATEETGLPVGRLEGEVARTSGQLRLFADYLREGSFLEVTLDSADATVTPPRPDLRRMLHPVGPVLVFSASNFPFAFSVLGGDAASALAAGCPVVVKAHPGHPRLSVATAEVATTVVTNQGWPVGTFGLIQGTAAGVRAVSATAIKAAGFTGSVAGGRALEQVAQGRPDPIPFYGELGSTNPVIVTPAALAERGTEIVEGFVGSFTLGVGQFCTKPGILFLPTGHGRDAELRDLVAAVPPTTMLSQSMHDAFQTGRSQLEGHPDTEVLATGGVQTTGDGRSAAPTLLRVSAPAWLLHHDVLGEECFGPLSLLVEYADRDELMKAVGVLQGSLVATVHLEQEDEVWVEALLDELVARTGRLVVNGWPTGLAVAWATQHGGPHPVTTNALHTSVGVTSARRWLRPVCYQDAPESLLPPALKSANPWRLPRRVDAVLESTAAADTGA